MHKQQLLIIPRRSSSLALLAVFTFLFWGGGFGAQLFAAGKVSGCERIALPQGRLGWTISGSWKDRDTLLIVDALNNEVLRFSKAGRPQGAISAVTGGDAGRFLPSVVKTRGDRLFLELANGRMVTLNQDGTTIGKKSILTDAVRGGQKVESMFLWDVTESGSDLVTFSDIQGPPGEWASGFLRIPLKDPAGFQVLHRLPITDASRTFYRLGYSYITSLGETAFVLLMEEGRLGIYKNEKGSPDLVPLKAFPVGFSSPPSLPRFMRRENFAPVMNATERSSMPTGLYGWENSLYVLSRVPDGASSRWSLSKIDPWADQLLWTRILPSRANHLTVVPGPEKWAFVEKGPVLGLGQQDTERLLFIPASRIRGGIQSDFCD